MSRHLEQSLVRTQGSEGSAGFLGVEVAVDPRLPKDVHLNVRTVKQVTRWCHPEPLLDFEWGKVPE